MIGPARPGSWRLPLLEGLRQAADGILAVLLAPRCLSCWAPVDSPSRGPVCPACWRSITPIPEPACRRCGDSLPTWRLADQSAGLCARCRRQAAAGAIAFGRSAGAYEGALRDLLHSLKYEGRRSLAGPLASLMRERGREALAGAELVVPVPLHWRRRWHRGFNQAEDLARHLGVPVARVLVRVRPTAPQFGLPAARRRRNVNGAFVPRRWRRCLLWGPRAEDRVRGKAVVVVDDVATTDATLEACAAVLRRLGAREVRALTAARALSRRP